MTAAMPTRMMMWVFFILLIEVLWKKKAFILQSKQQKSGAIT